MPEVRMARPTYSTEHGGRLEVNDVVDVQNSEHETGAETVRRWKRIGLAVDADHAPFDVAPTRTEEAVSLRRRIAQLEAQLADVQAPLGSAPTAGLLDDDVISTTSGATGPGPFDAPSVAFPEHTAERAPVDARDEEDDTHTATRGRRR